MRPLRGQRFKLGLFFAVLALQEFVSHWYLAQKLSQKSSWTVEMFQKQALLSVQSKKNEQSPDSRESLVLSGYALPMDIQRTVPTRGLPLFDLSSEVLEDLDDESKDTFIEDVDSINISGTLVKEQDDEDEGDWPLPFDLRPVQHLTSAESQKKMIVLVISRREMFKTRQVIRETWARGHDNVYFVLGTCCTIPPKRRKKWSCVLGAEKPRTSEQVAWDAECRAVDQQLAEEQSEHRDLIQIRAVDAYRNLPQKLKEGYAWAVRNTTAGWVVKTDDSSVVRVGTLERYLTTHYDATKATVVGTIFDNLSVDKKGKWAELAFAKNRYPKFPLGSHGHIVSRTVAAWIAEHKDSLFNYQREDVSLGIWLDESPLRKNVNWVTSRHVAGNGECKDSTKYMIGHNINSSKMKQCFQQMDQLVHTDVGSAWNVTTVSPRVLDVANRFDIIVKTVYAIFLKSGKGQRSIYPRRMYERHLEVWNQFKEPCTFAGEKDWFDAKKPCVKKSSAKDFQESFSKLVKSISQAGFDNQKSLVPVTGAGFPLNGAHRIAAAIALNFTSMPVQQVASTAVYKWDCAFFTRLGFEGKYSDFAMLQWTLHVRNVRTILFWPESKPEEIKPTHSLVQHHCGDVLYQKTIDINQKGVDSLAYHAYGDEEWLPEHIKKLQSIFNGQEDEERPISVFFVRPKSQNHLRSCKDKLKSLFGLEQYESSVHVSSHHDQTVLMAEMVLNPNSVMFLNHHYGKKCQAVASALGTLLKLSPVNQTSYVFPQDLMVNSGTTMSFFGLRQVKDVDLVFLEETRRDVLGQRDGVLVEAISETNFELRRHSDLELFVDPSKYGYCHGLKFASLDQSLVLDKSDSRIRQKQKTRTEKKQAGHHRLRDGAELRQNM